MARVISSAEIAEWKGIIEREKLVKKLEGKFIIVRSGKSATYVEETKFFLCSYKVRIPRTRKYRWVYLKWVEYKARIGKKRYFGRQAYVVNFLGAQQVLNLSLRCPLAKEFITIDKAEVPIGARKAENLLNSGKVYPFILHSTGKELWVLHSSR